MVRVRRRSLGLHHQSEGAKEVRDRSGADRWERWCCLQRAEISCGEGVFTAELASRCGALLAVDLSNVALARARERCAEKANVRFSQWDACSDPGLGRFDLVVCMDVICTIHRPDAKREALARVSEAVKPGGRLLLTALVDDPAADHGGSKLLAQGGQWVFDRFAEQDQLEALEVRRSGRHAAALFQAAGEPS